METIERAAALVIIKFSEGFEGRVLCDGKAIAVIENGSFEYINPEIGLSILRDWSTEEPYLCEDITECLARQEELIK